MKVGVDFSVFTEEDGAFGNLSGELNLITEPQIGDSVSFIFSDKKLALDPAIGFCGILKVTDRIISANREGQQLSLALSDVVVKSKTEAQKAVQYFESVFDLYAVRYEE